MKHYHTARLASIATALLISSSVVFASQIVQVAIPNLEARNRLLQSGLDIASINPGGTAEVVLMDQHDRDALTLTGLTHFVSLPDAESYFAARLAEEPGRDDMGGYPTFSEISTRLNDLHTNFPDIISEPFSIAQTIDGNDLLVVKVSDHPNDPGDEPEVFLAAAVHCREVITPLILLSLLDTITTHYGDDARIQHLVDDRQTYILCVTNPDGYRHNERTNPNGGGMWRKNRRRNGDGTYGVDINRNFGEHWAYDNIGSSPTPQDETFRGTEAFSEAESQGIREFVNDHRIKTSLSIHSYGNLCLYPYGYDYVQAEDRSLLTALSKRMIKVNNYLAGTGWEAIYSTNGENDDWFYGSDEHAKVMAFTIEAGTSNDSFWPALNRVVPLVRENIETCLALMEYADNPARPLPPPQVQGVEAVIEGRRPSLNWDDADDADNPAVAYRIVARIPGDQVVDDAPQGDTRWERVNFNLSQVQAHSGTYSYRAALAQPWASMTMRQPIIAPDTLHAWVNYTLRSNRGHGAALEVSTDGYTWTPLPGLGTSDLVMNNRNLGPVLTGTSNGWIPCWWTLGDYTGLTVKLRFRYYSMDVGGNQEFFYVDDITPLPAFTMADTLANNVQGTEWHGEEAVDTTFEYVVQAIDADGDCGFWSQPVRARLAIPGFNLRCREGWNLVSLNVEPAHPVLENLLQPWLDSGIVSVVKDGYGRFFIPRLNFNAIERWQGAGAYLIQLTRDDSLPVIGEPIALNTPLELGFGWNGIAYYPTGELEVEVALASISENIIIVKNGFGDFWAPSLGVDNLPPMAPGQGFQVKLTSRDTLVYPAGGRAAGGFDSQRLARPFVPPSPYNMSLAIDLPGAVSDGEILVRNRAGDISGIEKVTGRRIGLAAWQQMERNGAGFEPGEQINYLWRDHRGLEHPLLATAIEGSPAYQTNELALVSLSLPEGAVPSEFSVSASPNPFNGSVTLRLALPKDASAGLRLIDATGRIVKSIELGRVTAGESSFTLDAAELPAGVYLCQVRMAGEGSDSVRNIKLLLLR